MHRWVISIIFAISCFVIFILPAKDTDFGWHYRCGNETINNNKLTCISNNFSYYLADYQSYYPSHIYDLALATSYNKFGMAGVSIFGAGLIFASFWLLYLMINKNIFLAPVLFFILLKFTFGAISLGTRPQVLAYLLFVISLFIINKYKQYSSKIIYIYPLVTLIWVNTHLSFILSIVFIFCLLLDKLLTSGYNKFQVEILPTLSVLALSLLSTLINPFRTMVYTELYKYLSAPLSTTIAEWTKPPLLIIILMIILSIITIYLIICQKKPDIFAVSSILIVLILAVSVRRNVILLVTIDFIYLINILQSIYKKRFLNIFQKSDIVFAYVIILIMIGVMSMFNLRSIVSYYKDFENNFCKHGSTNYPCQTVNKYPDLKGNIFTAYEWGGFLIWKYPQAKVFSDGRMPAWMDEDNKSAYQAYLYILQSQPNWNNILRKYNTKYILISNGTFLDLLLQEKASQFGWQQVYRNLNETLYITI